MTIVVSTDDVLARLEWDSSEITETSVPLSLADIRAYIDDAVAQLAGVVNNAGLALDGLDATTSDQLKHAAIAYAVMESLAKSRMRGTQQHDAAREQWESIYRRYATRSASMTSRSSARTMTNANTTIRAQFAGRGYEF